MTDLIGNPNCWFSHVMAHFYCNLHVNIKIAKWVLWSNMCQKYFIIWAFSEENQIFCRCENKLLHSWSASFVFTSKIVLFYWSLKFQASSILLWLYRLVCVGPGRKPCRPFFKSRLIILKDYSQRKLTNEPPRGKTNNVVSEQDRHKLACTSTEKS